MTMVMMMMMTAGVLPIYDRTTVTSQSLQHDLY